MIVVYSTFPDGNTARHVGKVLLEEGLAGCVNIFDRMVSLYKWEGALKEEGEVAVLIKSTDDKKDKLMARLKTLHPYEVPAIFTLTPTRVDKDYFNWLQGQLK